MASFDSNDAPQPDTSESAGTIARNAFYGLVLFAVYLVLYGGFMYLNAFNRELMASRPFGGVNLAILYGMGLIVAALVLAAVYMYFCRASHDEGGAKP
jgi:uncharacterized membrane protein (DUF485 family)